MNQVATSFLAQSLFASNGLAGVPDVNKGYARANLGLTLGTAAGNVPQLDSGGKLLAAVLPAVSLVNTFVVVSQSEMLALTAETGDVAVRTDQSKTYILQGDDSATLSDWVELKSPTATTTSDVAEGSNLYFTDARVRTAIESFTASLTLPAPLLVVEDPTHGTTAEIFATGHATAGTGASQILAGSGANPQAYISMQANYQRSMLVVDNNSAVTSIGTTVLDVRSDAATVFGVLADGRFAYLRGGVTQFFADTDTIKSAIPIGVGLVNDDAAAFLELAGSTTEKASLRLRSGVAPTTPGNGDVWYDGTNFKVRLGGATKSVATITSGTADSTTFLRGDGTWSSALTGNMSVGNSGQYYLGDGTQGTWMWTRYGGNGTMWLSYRGASTYTDALALDSSGFLQVNTVRFVTNGSVGAANDGSGKWEINSGTITTSLPGIYINQTWNAGAVGFTAFRVRVTDTASAGSSLLANMTVGASSMFSVTKAGVLTTGGNATINTVNIGLGATGIFFGVGASANTGNNGIAIGNAASIASNVLGPMALGYGVAADTAYELMIGSGVGGAHGYGLALTGNSSTTINMRISKHESTWVDSTHATRKGRHIISVYDTAAREVIRAQASGTAAMIGFLGASAVAQQVSTTDLKDAFCTFGFMVNGGASPLDLDGGNLIAANHIETVGVMIDGGGAAIVAGTAGYRQIQTGGTIVGWTLLADQTGSIVIDVKKATYAGWPTTASITAAAKPTLAAAQKNTDTALTGWTTTVTSDDVLEFVVDSASTVTRVTLLLKIKRT